MSGARTDRRTATAALLAVLLAGCHASSSDRPRIVCLGDSITYGVTRSGRGGAPLERDPEGGYPGRLAKRLTGRAYVIGRGVGGATTTFWLADPRVGVGRTMWAAVAQQPPRLSAEPPAGAQSVLLAVLDGDRPDVVVVLLGANDLWAARSGEGTAIAGEILDRLDVIEQQARTVARVVLLATILPSRRDPPAMRDALNAGLTARHPDALPLAERFAAAGWEQLLGDEIHPNEAGYELIATTLAEELERRAIVSGPNTRR